MKWTQHTVATAPSGPVVQKNKHCEQGQKDVTKKGVLYKAARELGHRKGECHSFPWRGQQDTWQRERRHQSVLRLRYLMNYWSNNRAVLDVPPRWINTFQHVFAIPSVPLRVGFLTSFASVTILKVVPAIDPFG